MGRRSHHGGRGHHHRGHRDVTPSAGSAGRTAATPARPELAAADPVAEVVPPPEPDIEPVSRPVAVLEPERNGPAADAGESAPTTAGDAEPSADGTNGVHGGPPGGATTSQLRRFIKSRAYVPMHELRRRFAINGTEDDVSAVDVDGTRIFVGLPPREGRLLGELLRQGDVGYELSLDPVSPIVVGVYPMKPVPRH